MRRPETCSRAAWALCLFRAGGRVVQGGVDIVGLVAKQLRSRRSVSGGRRMVLAAGVALAVVACGSTVQPKAAHPSAVPKTPSFDLTAERALAQTGLGIALASTVLPSQLQIVVRASIGGTGSGSSICTALPGGGSVRTGASAAVETVFYDAACTQPFVVADATPHASSLAGGASQIVVSETAAYYGIGGAELGTLALDETAVVGGAVVQLHGLGIFTPDSGAHAPVQLGLVCQIPSAGSGTVTSFPCSGGVVQDFSSLAVALGSVTPLTLSVANSSQAGPVNFVGSGATVVTGPLGSMKLTNPSPTSLVVQGGRPYISFNTTGSAGAFVLFPPPPTAWTLTDSADGEQLRIAVTNDTTRRLVVGITSLPSGDSLATGSIDKSGTGSITYSDGSSAAITAWTLAG